MSWWLVTAPNGKSAVFQEMTDETPGEERMRLLGRAAGLEEALRRAYERIAELEQALDRKS